MLFRSAVGLVVALARPPAAPQPMSTPPPRRLAWSLWTCSDTCSVRCMPARRSTKAAGTTNTRWPNLHAKGTFVRASRGEATRWARRTPSVRLRPRSRWPSQWMPTRWPRIYSLQARFDRLQLVAEPCGGWADAQDLEVFTMANRTFEKGQLVARNTATRPYLLRKYRRSLPGCHIG